MRNEEFANFFRNIVDSAIIPINWVEDDDEIDPESYFHYTHEGTPCFDLMWNEFNITFHKSPESVGESIGHKKPRKWTDRDGVTHIELSGAQYDAAFSMFVEFCTFLEVTSWSKWT